NHFMCADTEAEERVKLHFCTLCRRQIAGEDTPDVEVVEKPYECVLCFGLLDPAYIEQVAEAVAAKLKDSPYDAPACTLALNLPISQTLRQTIIKQARPDLNGILVSVPFKIRNIDAYLPQLREASGLRLTLSSDLQLTIAFENDEFNEYDTKFLLENFPENFHQGRKRKFYEDIPQQFTKIKVEQILGRIKGDIARKYKLSSPSRPCSFTLSLERDPVFIAGRYCKYSRLLPQSPWSAEEKTAPREPGNSVAEKVCDPMKDKFGASETRFIASGREDLDVRMLGDGRPFAVELRNCRFTNSLKGTDHEETLRDLEKEINKQKDICVKYLTRVTREEAESLSVGEEGN
ncbi:hypothetical protein TELCIR_17597, partial [Teladorsagia circumcincta]